MPPNDTTMVLLVILMCDSGMREERDQDRLSKIQVLMGLLTYSQDHEVEVRKKNYSYLEDDPCMIGPYVEDIRDRIDTLLAHSDFKAWLQSTDSSILLLTGYNHTSIDNSSNHCWVSHVAYHMFESVCKLGHCNPLAFHIIGLQKDERLAQIILRILLQLLRSTPESLRDGKQYSELQAEIEEYRQSDEDGIVGSLRRIAVRVLNLFNSSEAVWIILDRVDRCCHPRTNNNHRNAFMQFLVHLVKSVKVRVRILAVVNGSDWTADRVLGEFETSRSRSLICHVAEQQARGGSYAW